MRRLQNIKRFLRDYFLSGLLVVVPLVASIYVLVKLSKWLYDRIAILPINYEKIAEALSTFLPKYVVAWITNSIHILEFAIALVLLFCIISIVGLITKIRLGNWMISVSERTLDRIPLVGMVYSALKQLLQAVFSGKGNFSRVVILEYPRRGIWSLGFVSREADVTFEKKTGQKLWSVFIPTTPNPTSGFLLMVPEDDLCDVELTIEQAFKIIISGGMVLPHEEAVVMLPEGSGQVMEMVRDKCISSQEEPARGPEENGPEDQ